MSEQIGQVLAKVAGQQTCGDSPRLGEQSVEGLLYRERAGTRLCLKWEEEGEDGLKGQDPWSRRADRSFCLYPRAQV